MFDTLQERYDIPERGHKWINTTLNTCWRVHKSRVKKEHYTKYTTDEERIQNRPDEIPLEDFKLLSCIGQMKELRYSYRRNMYI